MFRRNRNRFRTDARQTNPEFAWRVLGHVNPPEDAQPLEGPTKFYYLGPNHYPAGIYMPKGYNVEVRDGDDPGWTILRARCCLTEQVMTMWALEWVEERDTDGNLTRSPGGMKFAEDYES